MASMTDGPSGVVNISMVELGYSTKHLAAEFVDSGKQTTKLHASVNAVWSYVKNTEVKELYRNHQSVKAISCW